MAAPPSGSTSSAPAGASPFLSRSTPPRPTLGREWLLLTLAVLILLGVVVPPLVNLGRYRHRIVDDMGRSLGRPVGMRSVTLRLLPAPALVLAEVTVYEQPGFGAEPILRAPSLTAQLRLSSLWRGRLEVGRVELSDASLNLVRDGHGHWNINSVLLQAARVSNAPTGQRRAGPAPRFPYIAMTDSRINFKQGAEKLPYSLTNANLSMWLAEPDRWQLRLEAQPVRTDLALGLADTGLVRIEAQVRRTPSDPSGGIGQMPLTLHAEWSSAPLGQATRLLLGLDGGWRGDMAASADATGELNHLQWKTHLAIGSLHREEFTPSQPFSVDATCRGTYDRATHTVGDLLCRWPVGDGQLLLSGHLSAQERALSLKADQLPAGFLAAAAGLARDDDSPTLQISGTLAGTLTYSAQSVDGVRSPATASDGAGFAGAVFSGALQGPSLSLNAPGLQQPLLLSRVRLAASTPAPTGVPTLTLTADPVALGAPSPTALTAQLTAAGLLLHASGEASVKRLEEFGRAAHLFTPALSQLAPSGVAEFDLTRTAGWLGEEAVGSQGPLHGTPTPTEEPTTNGWLRLTNAIYSPAFLPESIAVPSAEATFQPGTINWTVPAALFHHRPVQVSASYPLRCVDAHGACVAHFRLSTANLDASELAGEDQSPRPLDALLERFQTHAGWPPLQGSLRLDSLTLGRLTLRQVTTNLRLSGKEARLDELHAHMLGGELAGKGLLSIEGRMARYTIDATLTNATAAAAGTFLRENWGPGTLSASTHLEVSGARTSEFAASAKGSFRAEWLHGALGTAPVAPTPLRTFPRWTAEGVVTGERLQLTQGALTGTLGETRPVSGTIGLDRSLELKVGAGGDSVTVIGTIAQPIQ